MPHDDFDDAADEESFDEDSDEAGDTIPCPYCHEPIHEDAERCPHCENYISTIDSPSAPRRWWLIVGVLLCLLIVYVWITAGW